MQQSMLVVIVTTIILGVFLMGGTALADDRATEDAVFFVQ
jgi:hypothetical protein